MPARMRPPAEKVRCPACDKLVNRVDGEYERHYVSKTGELCRKSKREIGQPENLNGDR